MRIIYLGSLLRTLKSAREMKRSGNFTSVLEREELDKLLLTTTIELDWTKLEALLDDTASIFQHRCASNDSQSDRSGSVVYSSLNFMVKLKKLLILAGLLPSVVSS